MRAIQTVNTGLRVIEVSSGWVEGPRVKGKLLAPSGDWYRNLLSGVGRVDVRLVIQTDDGQISYALVEDSRETLETIARTVGFADPERMRQSFIRVQGQPPRTLRRAARANEKAGPEGAPLA
jgi:hypothetical protein